MDTDRRVHVIKPSPLELPPEPLILMLSGCRWESCGGGQRPVALARQLAAGYGVIYHNPTALENETRGDIHIVTRPRMRKLMRQLTDAEPGVVINMLPTEWFHELAMDLQEAGWRYVYDLIDDWPAFYKAGDLNTYTETLERDIIETADVLVSSAPVLQQRLVEWSGGRPCALIRNGGPSQPLQRGSVPPLWQRGHEGTVVYIGYLAGQWFDWSLLRRTARMLPEVAFNVIGDARHAKHGSRPPENIIYHGEMPYAACMAAMAHADVGIIPFRDATVCAAVDPIKLYDHWAAGQPIAATHVMRELHGRPHCHIAPSGVAHMADAVRAALADAPIAPDEVRDLCAANSWQRRAAQLLDAIWRGQHEPEQCDGDRRGGGGSDTCPATDGARPDGERLRPGPHASGSNRIRRS